jgi:hypothetical protein
VLDGITDLCIIRRLRRLKNPVNPAILSKKFIAAAIRIITFAPDSHASKPPPTPAKNHPCI